MVSIGWVTRLCTHSIILPDQILCWLYKVLQVRLQTKAPPWIYTQYTKRSRRHIKDTVTCVRIWWIMETLDRLLIYYLTQKTKKAEHLLHHYVWDLEEGTELPFLVHHHDTWKQGQDHHTYFTTKRLGRRDRIATYFTTMRLGRGDRIATLTSVLWNWEEGTELPHLLHH